MKIIIGHLYHDLMNLYGDSGNVKALVYHLKEQGADVEVRNFTIGDPKVFADCDMLYVGSGTERTLDLALQDMKRDMDPFTEFIESGRPVLATGNSLELFGRNGIGVFNYNAEYTGRVVKDVETACSLVDSAVIGFENHAGHIEGMGDFIIDGEFLGTYVIGPILVRNPELCRYFVHKLIGAKDPAHNYSEEDYAYEEEAYKKTINAE